MRVSDSFNDFDVLVADFMMQGPLPTLKLSFGQRPRIPEVDGTLIMEISSEGEVDREFRSSEKVADLDKIGLV